MGIFASLVRASNTVTSNGTNVSNGDTVTLGGKVYTFQTVLTNVDGNILIGASAAASLQNLFDAINLTASVNGVTYAAAMSQSIVRASAVSATVLTLVAREPGALGNFIPATVSAVTLTLGGAVFSGGAGSWMTALLSAQVNAAIYEEIVDNL